MGLFKAKRKDVESYETDMDLPAFKVDANGYIMFDDPTLGGAAVFEVIPHITTESITHEDSVFHNESTNFKKNPTYEPTNNMLFGDARNITYPGWVHFVNSLQPQDSVDEPTHIQILVKKCRSRDWDTRLDYAVLQTHKELDSLISQRDTTRDPRKALLAARADDYLSLLEYTKKTVDELSYYANDIRQIPSYMTKFYLVISYTPSSEGWWLDGRDSDYYISDTSAPMTLFKNNEDKFIDKVTSIIGKRLDKKNNADVNIGGAEDDFFWIEADRTAQVISTRINKIHRMISRWNENNPQTPMPFHLKKMHNREVAALIRFFPNILTRYWDKIWNLQSDQNEVLYMKDVEKALKTHDLSFVEEASSLYSNIRDGHVDLRHSLAEQDDFLSKYKDKDFDDIGSIEGDHDDLFWSPEQEEKELARIKAAEEYQSEQEDLWAEFDASFALADELKTQSQRREEFLSKYKTRGRYNEKSIGLDGSSGDFNTELRGGNNQRKAKASQKQRALAPNTSSIVQNKQVNKPVRRKRK